VRIKIVAPTTSINRERLWMPDAIGGASIGQGASERKTCHLAEVLASPDVAFERIANPHS